MIALHHVVKSFLTKEGTSVAAVRDVSLAVTKGEFVILTGRSGSGKTTLLNLASGLTRPTVGEARLDGVDLWALSDRDRSRLRRRLIGFIFQFPSLLASLNVVENVLLPLSFEPNGTGEGMDRARRLLATVGLTDKVGAHPRHLSAGEQQRVVIARALINNPQVLLADEPTSNLDEQTEREIMEMLHGIHAATGITVLMVTHTSQLVHYGTRALEMAGGILRTDRQSDHVRLAGS